MLRIIGYTRVSTEEQGSHGVSLEAQREKIGAYCALYDLQLVDLIVDAGQSAKTLKRPGLQRALAMLKSGAADGLIVTKLDRLSRNVGDFARLIDEYFGAGGKQLFSVAESVSTTTPAGRMVVNIIVSVAQWEREEIASRVREALHHKLRRGERVGKLKYGYRLGDDGKTLIPDSREQQALRLMREWRDGGMTLRSIAAELDSLGYRTKAGKPWSFSAVRTVLRRCG